MPRTRLIKEGQTPVQTTWNANHLLAAATTFTVVILGQDHYVESQANPLDVDASLHKTDDLFPTEQMDWLADNIFTTLDCLETLVERGNHSAAVAKQLLERLCGTQSDLRTMYRLRFHKIAEGEELPSHSNYPHQHYHRRESSNSDRVYAKAQHPSTAVHASPSSASARSVATESLPSDVGLTLFQPMSATSLLDAVLMDPTELDFLGSGNHSNLLASLLQDSPPV